MNLVDLQFELTGSHSNMESILKEICWVIDYHYASHAVIRKASFFHVENHFFCPLQGGNMINMRPAKTFIKHL